MPYDLRVFSGGAKPVADVKYHNGASWQSAQSVWMHHGGAGWQKHWPPAVEFNQNATILPLTTVNVYANNGWSGWNTLIIPSATLSSKIAHITKLSVDLSSSRNDDDYTDDGDGVGGYCRLYLGGEYTVLSAPGSPHRMGTSSNSVTFSAGGNNTNNFGLINVPSNHLLVGISFIIHCHKERAATSYLQYYLITAPVINPTSNLQLSGGIGTSSGGGNRGDHVKGNAGGTAVATFGHSVRRVGVGYGFTIGGPRYDDADHGSRYAQSYLEFQSTRIS